MATPGSFMLVFKGMWSTSLVEQQAVASQLADELEVSLEQVALLVEWIGSPLCTGLSQEEALQLAEQMARIGVQVEVRLAGPA